MDMTFLLRSQRLLERHQPARLDHELLQATLAASRAVPSAQPCGEMAAREPLIELVTAGPDWKQAAVRQCGCFNRAEAGRVRNGA
jgi:hypothetical protein